ncbi:unnamed protein product [Pipistrellus nathusii]|uniref:Uncharacterized protein n=1 Tax=Pipistrellus nathusii TaxID=59473 RepID=A0ABN9ZU76_PIPNA
MDSLSSCWWLRRQGRCSWGPPFCGSRCPASRTCPPPQSGPSSPPGTRLSKEEGVSCFESVLKAVEGGSVGLGPPPAGKHRDSCSPGPAPGQPPPGPGPLGSLKPGPRVSFGFSFLSFEVGFCFSVFCMYLVQCCQGGASGFTTAARAGRPRRVSV